MDINNAFDEILKIQDKLDKTNAVNPKITVNGKEYTLYHEGNKPSASDVGAVPLSGNTKDSPITGNVYIQNYVKWYDSKNQKEINMVGFNETNKKAIYGGGNNTGGITFDTAGGSQSIDIWDSVNGKTYKLYHTGNKPTANDIGANTTLFSGEFSSGSIGVTNKNVNSCVSSDCIFTVPSDGIYLFVGIVQNVKSLKIWNSDYSTSYVLFRMSNYTLSTDESMMDCIPFSRARKLTSGAQWKLLDDDKEVPIWMQLNIIKLV